MAVYAIGDIQGCLGPFERLLEKLGFDPASDRLWLTGDLVNRGPDSVGVLRMVKQLGERAVVVLGNHDLHLLCVWAGHGRLKHGDSLQQVLQAPDADDLLQWLRQLPLVHHDPDLGYAMIHAGLFPGWSLDDARRYAAEAEAALRDDRFAGLMAHMYGNEPRQWNAGLEGWDRLRFIINACTRMRYCEADGSLLLDYKGSPDLAPEGHIPWFEVNGRHHQAGDRIIFGHWSTLGFRDEAGVVSIDTGCLWGGQLTAVRLDDALERISLPCPTAMPIGSDHGSP